MKAEELVANITSAAFSLATAILSPAKLTGENIRRISLKCSDSPGLPIFTYLSEAERNLLPEAIQEANL